MCYSKGHYSTTSITSHITSKQHDQHLPVERTGGTHALFDTQANSPVHPLHQPTSWQLCSFQANEQAIVLPPAPVRQIRMQMPKQIYKRSFVLDPPPTWRLQITHGIF